ncbi:hypothetical protein SDC9_180991 [bioreactor metagenome]|uniref:Uncharacterized protein n=1 Tax=bioreactor metagenome TaxID=1076179 RepID=A0A645HCI2_9ZZZZ
MSRYDDDIIGAKLYFIMSRISHTVKRAHRFSLTASGYQSDLAGFIPF